MLQRLYARMLDIAAGPNALTALLIISFVESSFFPIPPDILLIPMILARPRDAWRLAAYCTVASVAGGLLGYAIGYFLFDTIGRPILEFYHAMDRYDASNLSYRFEGRVSDGAMAGTVELGAASDSSNGIVNRSQFGSGAWQAHRVA